MSNTSSPPLGEGSESISTDSKSGSLLNEALVQLPKVQQRALIEKALERKLELDASAAQSELRHRASSIDMANTISQLRALENSTGTDYTLKAEYDTASGRTSVEVRKSNTLVIIVIAVVIGILALILLGR